MSPQGAQSLKDRTTELVRELFSQESPGAGRRTPPAWLRPAWARLVAMVVVMAVVLAFGAGARASAGTNPFLNLVAGALVVAVALSVYAALVRFLERRPVTELDPKDAASGLRTGVVIGLGLFTATIALVDLCADYGTHGGVSVGGALAVLGLMTGVATTEELLFRGVVFRLLEEMTGTRWALAISTVAFGALHLLNPGATVWGALAVGIEGGLMLGAAYAATRSLWLPIGLHFAWNFAESGLFGTTVSGNEDAPTGLVQGVVDGPAVLTGGDFGPEASLFAILVCLVPAVLFLRAAKRRGDLRPRRASSAR
ncbi:CPBP family intramembrane glutamic endopeptidase [Streptomyces sp. NPDC059786]|uniref:CPBP family intramembrane glutamic endopeptidase n=1 Tax=Streptomyces sp. NPDC059786 TaxID=3346946 RepID=UPI00364DA3C4